MACSKLQENLSVLDANYFFGTCRVNESITIDFHEWIALSLKIKHFISIMVFTFLFHLIVWLILVLSDVLKR